MSDVVDRVKKIVVEHLSVEEGSISDSSSFIDDIKGNNQQLLIYLGSCS